jgi:hypothetical protein
MQNLKSFQVFESTRQISRFKMDSSPPNNASSVASDPSFAGAWEHLGANAEG